MEALAALAQGDCEIAGFHLPVDVYEDSMLQLYLQFLSREEHCLIHWPI